MSERCVTGRSTSIRTGWHFCQFWIEALIPGPSGRRVSSTAAVWLCKECQLGLRSRELRSAAVQADRNFWVYRNTWIVNIPETAEMDHHLRRKLGLIARVT